MLMPQTIYAGDTPLACTVRVEQTGPMQLTVRAGRFTTTGEARITPEQPDDPGEIAAGRAERLPDGVRVRRWLLDAQGAPWRPSVTHTLRTDAPFPLTADSTSPKTYLIELGLLNGTPEVLCRSQLAGEALPDPPAGWEPVHWLAGPFVVPAGATTLDALAIPVFAVLPDFPPGTTAADWATQRGVI
jgi:hypothetical protein